MTSSQHDSLGDRMKRYESVTKQFVMPRTATIIRLDGCAFHTFTKNLKHIDPNMNGHPFSPLMHQTMVDTTGWLFNRVQNCVLAYTQSDEISLLLKDWNSHTTQQWFGGSIQKMVSVSAAHASNAFNSYFNIRRQYQPLNVSELATFDSRVYNLPLEEVTNYFIWRQQDASRNSVQMLGHHMFSQREMQGKKNSEVQEMLFQNHAINWNDIETWKKRGTCIKATNSFSIDVDENIPIFTENREYIEETLRVTAT